MKINWHHIEDVPDQTCPQVDKVLDYAIEITDCVDDITKNLKHIGEELESLREQNCELRNWGDSMEKELLRLEDLPEAT